MPHPRHWNVPTRRDTPATRSRPPNEPQVNSRWTPDPMRSRPRKFTARTSACTGCVASRSPDLSTVATVGRQTRRRAGGAGGTVTWLRAPRRVPDAPTAPDAPAGAAAPAELADVLRLPRAWHQRLTGSARAWIRVHLEAALGEVPPRPPAPPPDARDVHPSYGYWSCHAWSAVPWLFPTPDDEA